MAVVAVAEIVVFFEVVQHLVLVAVMSEEGCALVEVGLSQVPTIANNNTYETSFDNPLTE